MTLGLFSLILAGIGGFLLVTPLSPILDIKWGAVMKAILGTLLLVGLVGLGLSYLFPAC